MEYDLVKDRLARIIGERPFLRRLFFAALDRLFLRSRYIIRELENIKKSGFNPQKILDAGAGFGQYSFRLAETFPEAAIIGVDLKTDFVNSANRFAARSGYRNIRFQVADLTSLSLTNEFDLILSVDVMEHIEADRLVLKNIGNALKPGGYFIMTTPYSDPSSGSQEVFVAEHVRPGYTRTETDEKFTGGGLNLQRFTITYGPWGRIAWRLLQRLPMIWLKGRTWLLPAILIYFLAAYPIAWVCMQLDMKTTNENGGGILAVAIKDKLSIDEDKS